MNMSRVSTEEDLKVLNWCTWKRDRLRRGAIEKQTGEDVVNLGPVLVLNILLVLNVLLFGYGETVINPVEDIVKVGHRSRLLAV